MELTLDSIRDLKLYQNKKGYRFSADAIILYSFVNLPKVQKIADIGAGSGIIGLLLAKKYCNSEVALIEVQDNLVKLAEKNAVLNQLEDRVKAINCDARKIKTICSPLLFSANSFDLVISNPPFRRQQTGLISPADEKAIARHEIKLTLIDLVAVSHHLLRSKGRLCIIYHPSRLAELIDTLRKKQMEPKRLRFVYPNIQSEAKMVLVEAVKNGRSEIKIEKPLFIYKKNGTHTDEMKRLY